MLNWAASSEMLVMLAVLAFLIYELVSVRRSLKKDREKAADAAKAAKSDPN